MKTVSSWDDSVLNINFISNSYAERLNNAGIFTVGDLLMQIPYKYRDTSQIEPISKLIENKEGMILGEVASITRIRAGRYILVKANIFDDSGRIEAVWFNQPYIINTIKKGNKYLFEGKITEKGRYRSLNSPQYELWEEDIETKKIHLGRITPFYESIGGLSSKWIRSKISSLKEIIPALKQEELSENLLKKYDLITENEALLKIHFPETFEDIDIARKRLGFDELLNLSIKIEKELDERRKYKAISLNINEKIEKDFFLKLPYILTKDQHKAIEEIKLSLKQNYPMNRLLNGDVGSGKTVVAVLSALVAFSSGYSTLFMAPTTILAQQHYKSIKEMLKDINIDVLLLTSNNKMEIKEETPSIIIGTHAILHAKKLPKKIGLVIVDEQHRFGVLQRNKLKDLTTIGESVHPHYLTMTATPIPRTLTHILYGDMEISIIKELPKNRTPIKSYLVPHEKRDNCLEWIKKKIVESNYIEQAFFILPLIEETEKIDAKSAVDTYKKLSTGIYKDLNVGLLHGKLSEDEKNDILLKFNEKQINILVSTSVIEVGIDIPDATMMVIENAERFGLAQLHQFRGRIGRGKLESHCFVFAGDNVAKTSDANKRLKYFCTHLSGFDVAEYDLHSRGPGEVYGVMQSGIPKFKIADVLDLESVKLAREVAKIIMNYKL